MHNAVVKAIVRAYHNSGYSTLRFNFRGVEQSEGDYDNGIGEQEDVRSALKVLADLGIESIDLAGYSFGASVNAAGLKRFDQVDRLIMVSPPVELSNFDGLIADPRVRLVITGDKDEIAPTRAIEEKMPIWNPRATLRNIEGADHFFGGKNEEIMTIIEDFLEKNRS